MLANGKEVCTCKRTKCERHGDCEACLMHHQLHKKYPPVCIPREKKKGKPDKK